MRSSPPHLEVSAPLQHCLPIARQSLLSQAGGLALQARQKGSSAQLKLAIDFSLVTGIGASLCRETGAIFGARRLDCVERNARQV